jgi:hypothetical protein
VAALATYFWLLDRRWPIPTTAAALQIGATWTASTMAFEFGFGRYVGPNPKSWSEMLGDYDITKGQLWPLVIAFELVGPLRSALRDCGWDADLRGVRGIIHRWSPRSAP